MLGLGKKATEAEGDFVQTALHKMTSFLLSVGWFGMRNEATAGGLPS